MFLTRIFFLINYSLIRTFWNSHWKKASGKIKWEKCYSQCECDGCESFYVCKTVHTRIVFIFILWSKHSTYCVLFIIYAWSMCVEYTHREQTEDGKTKMRKHNQKKFIYWVKSLCTNNFFSQFECHTTIQTLPTTTTKWLLA